MNKVRVISLTSLKNVVMRVIKECREKNINFNTKEIVRECVSSYLMIMNAKDEQVIRELRALDEFIDEINAEFDDLPHKEQQYAAQEINDLLKKKNDLMIKAGFIDKPKLKGRYSE